MEGENQAEKALILIRSRICNPSYIFTPFSDSPESNYSKLKFIISNSVTEACNNSILLLGPRGCGKIAVLNLVLRDLLAEHPDMVSVIRLNGLLHSDDNCALKEIARQLCVEHQLLFSKMASFDDNSQFMISMLRECGLAHKTIIFVLDEFDLFAQGKQRLLYSLLDAMQSITSQAVVIGVSCRLDADQLLEKRVRSRFSHRKLLFLPPSKEELQRLLEHILSLPIDSSFSHDYAMEFNAKLHKIVGDCRFTEIVDTLSGSDSTVNHLLKFLFRAVCCMDLDFGFLTLENFKTAILSIQRQPKLECLQGTPVWPEQGKGNPLDGKISSSQRHLAKIDQIPRGGVEVFRFADEINRFQHSPVRKEAESHFKKLGPTGGGRDTQMQETEKSGGEVPIRRTGAEKVRSRFWQVYCRRARLHVRGSSEVGLQRVRFGPRVNSIVIKPSPPHIEEHADDHIGSSNSMGEFLLLRRSGSVDSLISSPDPLANIRHNSSGHAEEGSACNGGVNGDGLPGPDGGSEQGAPLKGSLELAQEVSRVKDSVEVKPTLSPGVEDSVDDRVNWSSVSDNSYDGSSDEEGLWRMQVAEPEVEKESSEEVDSRSIGSIAQEAEEGQLTRRVCLANVARSVEVSKLLGLQFPGGAEQAYDFFTNLEDREERGPEGQGQRGVEA